MNLEELAGRIQHLEDLEAIKGLKARYSEACDDNYDPLLLSSLFVEDGVWDGGSLFGVHRGRDAIREYFSAISNRITFSIHYCALNPNITVDGDTAKAHWYGLVPMQLSSGDAVWFACTYDDVYVKVGGEWFIKEVKVVSLFNTPYGEGWAKTRFL